MRLKPGRQGLSVGRALDEAIPKDSSGQTRTLQRPLKFGGPNDAGASPRRANSRQPRREVKRCHEVAREPALPSASLKSAGHDGPLLYPGPLCGGESGSTGRAAGVDRMSTPFRQHTDVLSKSPAPTHGLAAQGWAASAKRGGLSLLLRASCPPPFGPAAPFAPLLRRSGYSWPRKEKVTRAPQAIDRSCSSTNGIGDPAAAGSSHLTNNQAQKHRD